MSWALITSRDGTKFLITDKRVIYLFSKYSVYILSLLKNHQDSYASISHYHNLKSWGQVPDRHLAKMSSLKGPEAFLKTVVVSSATTTKFSVT